MWTLLELLSDQLSFAADGIDGFFCRLLFFGKMGIEQYIIPVYKPILIERLLATILLGENTSINHVGNTNYLLAKIYLVLRVHKYTSLKIVKYKKIYCPPFFLTKFCPSPFQLKKIRNLFLRLFLYEPTLPTKATLNRSTRKQY